MSKLRQASVRQIEQSFSCTDWQTIDGESLRNYVVTQGIRHLLRSGESETAQALLQDVHYLMKRVTHGAKSITQLGLEYKTLGSGHEGYVEWKAFVLSVLHLLKRAPSNWGAERVLMQLGLEHCTKGVKEATEQWRSQHANWPVLIQQNTDEVLHGHPIAVLLGHQDAVRGAIKLSASQVLSWSRDNSLAIWNVHTGEREAELVGHEHIISKVILWNELIYSFSWDKTVRIWDMSGDLVACHTISSSIIQGAYWTDHGFVFGDDDDLYFSSTDFSTTTKVIHDADAEGTFPACVMDNLAISWYAAGELKLWSISAANCVHTIAAHNDENIRGVLPLDAHRFVSWSGPEDYLLNRGNQPDSLQLLCLWTVDGQQQWSRDAHQTAVLGVKPYGTQQLISWGWDGELKLWNVDSGDCVDGLTVGQKIKQLLVLSNGTIIFSSSPAGRISTTLHSWKPSGQHVQHQFLGRGICSLVEHNDSLLVAVSDKVIRFDLERLIEKGVFVGHKGWIQHLLPWDKQRFISYSDDESLRFWDLEHSVSTALNPGHESGVLGVIQLEIGVVSVSPDSIWCWPKAEDPFSLVGSDAVDPACRQLGELKGVLKWSEHVLVCWSSDRIYMLEAACSSVSQFGSEDPEHALVLCYPWSVIRAGNRLLSISEDGGLALWDPTTMLLIKQVRLHKSEALGASVLSDGRILSWSGEAWSTVLGDATVRIWDSALNPLGVMEGHRSWLGGACQQEDLLFSWSRDIRVWTETGELLHVLEGDAFVHQLRRYGQLLLSWNGEDWSDSSVHLWDLEDGKELASLKGHNQGVKNAVLLSDGQILSWGDDAIKLWDVQSGSCLKTWALPHSATSLPALVWDSGIFEGAVFSGKGFMCARSGEFWAKDGNWQRALTNSEDAFVLTSGATAAVVGLD